MRINNPGYSQYYYYGVNYSASYYPQTKIIEIDTERLPGFYSLEEFDNLCKEKDRKYYYAIDFEERFNKLIK